MKISENSYPKGYIKEFVLNSKTGMQLSVLNYGATITSLKVPVEGRTIDVVLGFDSPQDYVSSFEFGLAPYFGAVVGRFAGRIRYGQFELNDEQIQLSKNYGDHHIHGGKEGLSQKIWDLVSFSEGDEPSISFALKSPHLEENFPGEVDVQVTYTLTLKNELEIQYKAKSTEDTLLNLTQHSYFNLDGHQGDVTNQELKLNASQILETDSENVPTGKLMSLEKHPFDFSKPKAVPLHIDDAFVLTLEHNLAAELFSTKSNLHMKVYTNQPCLQVYVGGKVNPKLKTKSNSIYHTTSGICFETQAFPDAPNHKNFPSAILNKDENYYQNTKFQFNILDA
ncbi:aldose epimerase family protein [Psychroflexus montanilacus]|uniref:aldose epimerase family protein n=1 Tax=Psychroflexus montanilacus TaxID=2873598 RepID=UPI001CCABE62|nr:aldose epimerase family protein [Psychroflexus montanilacus]MBZ9651987.1 galactose mutarotase [Psychroflexus montanilacus]